MNYFIVMNRNKKDAVIQTISDRWFAYSIK